MNMKDKIYIQQAILNYFRLKNDSESVQLNYLKTIIDWAAKNIGLEVANQPIFNHIDEYLQILPPNVQFEGHKIYNPFFYKNKD